VGLSQVLQELGLPTGAETKPTESPAEGEGSKAAGDSGGTIACASASEDVSGLWRWRRVEDT